MRAQAIHPSLVKTDYNNTVLGVYHCSYTDLSLESISLQCTAVRAIKIYGSYKESILT